MVTWLPKSLGWVDSDYQIFLGIWLRSRVELRYYSWFAVTEQGSRVGSQNNTSFFAPIYVKKEF